MEAAKDSLVSDNPAKDTAKETDDQASEMIEE